MQHLIWFLLPVAVASGWWYGWRHALKSKEREVNYSPDYYRGLNYLLNEQPDKAIEVFIKMVEVDSDTVETHLALGGLFRRRGEVERAIRIHQNLIARPMLTQRQRGLALLELGKDYMNAGLLDRAESLFHDLLKFDIYQIEALSNLQEVYQQESEWDKAIGIAKQLSVLQDNNLSHVVAHYYCELAEEKMRAKNKEKAITFLKQALDTDEFCVRASLLLAELALAENDYEGALQHYLKIFDQDKDFIPEMMGKALQAIQKGASGESFRVRLSELMRSIKGEISFPGLTCYIENTEGRARAETYIRQQLEFYPTLNVLKEWLELQYGYVVQNDLSMQSLLRAIEKMLKENNGYSCHQCGYTGRLLHWRCPSCKNWGAIKPAYTIGYAA